MDIDDDDDKELVARLNALLVETLVSVFDSNIVVVPGVIDSIDKELVTRLDSLLFEVVTRLDSLLLEVGLSVLDPKIVAVLEVGVTVDKLKDTTVISGSVIGNVHIGPISKTGPA